MIEVIEFRPAKACLHADKTSCFSGAPAFLAYVSITSIKEHLLKIPKGAFQELYGEISQAAHYTANF